VDVSAQQSAALCTLAVSLAAQYGHANFSIPGTAAAEKKTPGAKKDLDLSGSGSRTRRSKWQVRDGLVEMHIDMGPAGGRFSNNQFRWMASEGGCDADIAGWDWVSVPQRILKDELSDDDLERARTQVGLFLARFTKEELLEKAIEHRLLCAPIATTQDLLDSRQLGARQFFQTVQEASGARRTLPGNFAAGVPQAFAALLPAPALGQHSSEVLRDWLAMPEAELASLRAQGVIA
jgi:transcriptional regulator of met regulon